MNNCPFRSIPWTYESLYPYDVMPLEVFTLLLLAFIPPQAIESFFVWRTADLDYLHEIMKCLSQAEISITRCCAPSDM